MINKDLVRMTAYLPVKLAVLVDVNPELALQMMRHWGNGTKSIPEIWDTVSDAVEGLAPKTPTHRNIM